MLKDHYRVGAFALVAGAAITIAACQSSLTNEQVARPALQTKLNERARPVYESFGRAGGPMDAQTGAVLLDQQRLRAARKDNGFEPEVFDAAPGELKQVKYTAREAPAEDVLRVLVGEMLERSYVIHPAVVKRGETITLDIDEQMSQRDIEDLVGALAALHGWSLDVRGETLFVGPSQGLASVPTAPLLHGKAANPSELTGVRVFRADYLPAKQLADAVKEFLGEGGKTVISGNTLLVVERIRQLNRMADIVEALDTPSFDNAEIWTYGLNNGAAADASRILTSMAQASGLASSADAIVSFIPVPTSNRLIVIANQSSIQPMVRRWIEMVDQPPDAAYKMDPYLYRIQHYEPAALLRNLQGVFVDRIASDGNDQGVRLILEQSEDLLTIVASPEDFHEIYAYLRRVDIARQQVGIQVLIAEVTLNDTLQWGVQYFLQGEADNLDFELTALANAFGPVAPTGTAFLLGTDGFALVEALDQETEVTVLSQPILFARDKEQASFQSGAEVPIVTATQDSATQTGGTTGIRNEVEYRDTGIILDIQPEINEGGSVTLRITQEITDAIQNSTSGIDSPTFTLRRVSTSVTVPHGNTVLLAGIVDKRITDRVGKVPILGDVPVLGLAFQNIDKRNERTELLLTLTPTIINDPADSQPILSEFLLAAHHVVDAVQQFDTVVPSVFLASDPFNDSAIEVYERNPVFDQEQDDLPPPAPADVPGARSGPALNSLDRLAGELSDPDSDETRMVALFLNELTDLAAGG